MAFKGAKNARLYIKGYDMSGRSNRMTPTLAREFEDVTCFSDAGHKWFPKFTKDGFEFSGFYDAASGNITEIMNTLRTATSVGICCILLGPNQSDDAVCGEGVWQEGYSIEMPILGMLTLNGSFQFEGAVDVGIVLQVKAQKTADGNGTGVDQTAPSSAGATAFLQVFECGAGDALIVKVQDDDNAGFLSPNDLITFTIANGITAERKTASGTIQRYVRVVWAGTLPYQVTFAVCFKRN